MPDEKELQLYTAMRVAPDGTQTIIGYAYGDPWVEQALFMDDIRFDTPDEAKAWWEKNYGVGK